MIKFPKTLEKQIKSLLPSGDDVRKETLEIDV